MENTFCLYVESLNEQWEMPDNLALSWEDYQKEHPPRALNADRLRQDWFATLTPAGQAQVSRTQPTD